MPAQFRWVRGPPMLGEVGRRAKDNAPQCAKTPSPQSGVRQVGDTNDHVEPAGRKVGERVRELEVDFHFGISPHVFGYERNEEIWTEQYRGSDAQHARWL